METTKRKLKPFILHGKKGMYTIDIWKLSISDYDREILGLPTYSLNRYYDFRIMLGDNIILWKKFYIPTKYTSKAGLQDLHSDIRKHVRIFDRSDDMSELSDYEKIVLKYLKNRNASLGWLEETIVTHEHVVGDKSLNTHELLNAFKSLITKGIIETYPYGCIGNYRVTKE